MFDTAEKAARAVAHSFASATAINTVSSVAIDESTETAVSPDDVTCALSESEHDEVATTPTVRAIANACRRTFTLTD